MSEDASEVYKGRSLKTNAIVAMKKILVHNEKDGVRCPDYRSSLRPRFDADLRPY
jgi:hypothetical protein